MAGIKEINLVCMSGQGSVQAVEVLAKAYFAQHNKFVASQVFPGPRSKSAPVVSYLKIGDRPIHSISTNRNPTEAIVFWDGLLQIAARGGHEVVADAIGRLRSGLLIINTTLRPDELQLPFAFTGTLALVDADRIVKSYLHRDPPPVGTSLLGAYAAVTGSLDLDVVAQMIRERFPGENGRRNVEAMRETAAAVAVWHGFSSGVDHTWTEPDPVDPDSLPEWTPINRTVMRSIFDGGASVWRTKVPQCNDTSCLCGEACLSEMMCPDNTGFIVRAGLDHQGYRVNVDYCRGCGICAEVCVYGAIQMVNEHEVRRTNPDYDGIAVRPFLNLKRS